VVISGVGNLTVHVRDGRPEHIHMLFMLTEIMGEIAEKGFYCEVCDILAK